MSNTSPIPFTWTGAAMEPLPGFAKRADAQFVIGEKYVLEVVEERSAASHRHYFAALRDGWLNLPERLAQQFQTTESLRKFALIKCGYANQRQLVCRSASEAKKVAAFVQPADEYAIVSTIGSVVTVFTAQSQNMRSMDKKTFNESAAAVLDYVASLIGSSRQELADNAREVA